MLEFERAVARLVNEAERCSINICLAMRYCTIILEKKLLIYSKIS